MRESALEMAGSPIQEYHTSVFDVAVWADSMPIYGPQKIQSTLPEAEYSAGLLQRASHRASAPSQLVISQVLQYPVSRWLPDGLSSHSGDGWRSHHKLQEPVRDWELER